jgi:stearoyl-CoA desaturase (delta-9 desaturase)
VAASTAPMPEPAAPARFQISWAMAIPYAAFYVACLAIPFYGVSWRAIGLFAASFFARMLFLSIGYHRYLAHRAFETSRATQLVLAVLGTLTIQGGPLWWAQTHRHHHRHADTPQDVHAPSHHGFLYAHFGWFLDVRHVKADHRKVPDLARFAELRWLDSELRIPLYVGYALLMYWLGGMQGLLWGFCLATVALWNLTHWVQSGSHTLGGYRRYPSADASRNHVVIGLISLGEWHNNHHHSPSSSRQGHAWWELDVGYYLLTAMSWVGLVWNLKQPRRPREA